MKRIILFLLMVLSLHLSGQNVTVSGTVHAEAKPLQGVEVQVENQSVHTVTDKQGRYQIQLPQGEYWLLFSAKDFQTQRYFLRAEANLQVPTITLHRNDFLPEANVIELSDEDLDEEQGGSEMVSGFLQASRDIYFQRAAFDFGQAFYSPRGYDSKDVTVLINGIPMNKVETGRAQWGNWGGLNDVTRNQTITTGVAASEYDFGGVFGSNYIAISPSQMRTGGRFTLTGSNRTYSLRSMATYNSGIGAKGFGYFVSGSTRWASSGYVHGTSYNSYGLSAGLEYKASPYYSVNLLGLYSYNYRGKSAPLTQEAIALAGTRYNPNWGYLNGRFRNAKMKRIDEPIFILSQTYQKENLKLTANLAYQFGQVGDSRIQYGQAQNPDPSYYTNMPTYYYALLGTDPYALDKTAKQIAYFQQHKQLDWDKIYWANHNSLNDGLYALAEDVVDTKSLTANILFFNKLNKYLTLNAGATYQHINTENYQQIIDLLGAKYFLNKSYYSGEYYDENQVLTEGDYYQYHYKSFTQKANAFAQLRFHMGKADFYAAGKYDYTSYQREGVFTDNAIYTDSQGDSKVVNFNNLSAKAGLTYSLTGRHILQFNTGYFQLPQTLNNVFVNVRNSNSDFPFELKPEEQFTADASYIIRMPYIKTRLTGYYTQFHNAMERSYFFTQSRVGNDSAGFITQTVAGINKTHFGVELGAEVQIIPELKATGVASVNKYKYINNPYLVQSSDKQLVSQPLLAYIEGYNVAAGPQNAFSLGLEYRSPKYWWVGATSNWLTGRYVSIAHSLRTTNIYLDPDTGALLNNIDPDKVAKLLEQEELPTLFVVNLSAGKSWRINGKYINAFLSVNNLFDTQFKTGGFEQARKGSYKAMLEDQANGYPTFGNKYFLGYGATYMLNLTMSF